MPEHGKPPLLSSGPYKNAAAHVSQRGVAAFHSLVPLSYRNPLRRPKVAIALSAARPPRNRSGRRRSAASNNSHQPRKLSSLTPNERLQKVLSHMGVASRREAEELIFSKQVRVNGRMVDTPGTLINAYEDVVVVEGKRVELPELSWLAVHKPRGVLSVALDDKRSISNYAPGRLRRGLVAVSPIEESFSGLVILTNDRACAVDLTKPGNAFVKNWIVDCEGHVPFSVVQNIQNGIELGEGEEKSIVRADVQPLGSGPVEVGQRRKMMLTRFEVRLRDNRRQIIRRLFEACGHTVFRASRNSFGPVVLGSLKRGDCRPLSPKEFKALKRGISEKTLRRLQRR